MDRLVRQMTSFAANSKTVLAVGVTLGLFLAILGIYKLGNYLNLLLIRAKYEHSSTADALDKLASGLEHFNSPHDSGYASEGSDSGAEDDPELSSLRKAIKMCEDEPKTPREDREVAFEVFAEFARASTGSRAEALGLGVRLGDGEKGSGKTTEATGAQSFSHCICGLKAYWQHMIEGRYYWKPDCLCIECNTWRAREINVE